MPRHSYNLHTDKSTEVRYRKPTKGSYTTDVYLEKQNSGMWIGEVIEYDSYGEMDDYKNFGKFSSLEAAKETVQKWMKNHPQGLERP